MILTLAGLQFAFYPWVHIAGFAKIDLSKYPNVEKWYKSLAAEEKVKTADSKLPKS